jgi:predicted O-methyltransferase YrrM
VTGPREASVYLDWAAAAAPDPVEQCFRAALRALKSGGLLLADNVIQAGAMARGETQQARRVHRCNELVRNEPELTGLILPVGDGLSVSVRS